MNTRCIVLFGHNPRKHSWTPIFNMINFARSQGAKVIVLDPRISDQAEVADLHLRLRAGTDAAMCLGWLKVIFDEKLYDEEFVRDWCVGFEELKARVDEYPLERVEAITGVDRELIAQAARIYAQAEGAVIPGLRLQTSRFHLHRRFGCIRSCEPSPETSMYPAANRCRVSALRTFQSPSLGCTRRSPRNRRPNKSAITSTRLYLPGRRDIARAHGKDLGIPLRGYRDGLPHGQPL